jgi:GNAT superfamily N-acetyltransferase
MPFTDEYLFVQFDKHTLANDQIRHRLLQFYCDTWKYDPNFGEYRKCPACRKFYNYNQVETNCITTCSGSVEKPHNETSLVEAWTEDGVWEELLPLLEKGSDFFGAVAVVPQTERIAGFVWGYVIDFSELTSKWDPEIISRINLEMPSERVTYFQEIAVDQTFRKFGIGTVLCRMLVQWMKNEHPTLPSFLHTHRQSPAYRLFQKAGYCLYEVLPGPNVGRILLACNRGNHLTPENLINY